MRSPVTSSRQPRTNSEAGYILLAVLFLVALILLSLAVAAPRIAKSIQRDKELELIHRGEQYNRPYSSPHDLVSKGLVSEAEYSRISAKIAAN